MQRPALIEWDLFSIQRILSNEQSATQNFSPLCYWSTINNSFLNICPKFQVASFNCEVDDLLNEHQGENVLRENMYYNVQPHMGLHTVVHNCCVLQCKAP